MKHLFALFLAAALAQPAAAAVIGVAEGEGAHIDFHDDAGPCVGKALRAEHVPDKGTRVAGCWTTDGRLVFVVFLDGEIARVPAQAVRPPTKL